jgi:hypothetical protein
MSDYTGIYIQRLSDGSIFAVTVKDPYGNITSINMNEYLERGIMPHIKDLPDKPK